MDVLPEGAVFEGMRIVRLLGRGGMGVVYEAFDVAAGRPVALKVVATALARDPELLARFEREAQAGARVRHPNVAVVHRSGVAGGRAFIAFELLPGGNLKERTKRLGRLPWREAAALGAGVARGLAAIHAAGLVHRDVKPENVLLDERGAPKLSDFGLVRGAKGGSLSGGLTGEGDLLGTLEFMAPEQADGAASVDGRADLYALGATLHYLVAGRPPFEGQGIALLAKHLREQPAPIGALVPDAPPALEALILALLAKDPAARPESAGEVAARLDAVARGEPIAAGRRAPLAGLALVVAIATVVGAAVLARRDAVESVPVAPRPIVAPPAPSPPPPRPAIETPAVDPRFSPVDAENLWKRAPADFVRPTASFGVLAARRGLSVTGERAGERTLATTASDGTILLFRATETSIDPLRALSIRADVVRFAADGSLVALARAANELRLIDARGAAAGTVALPEAPEGGWLDVVCLPGKDVAVVGAAKSLVAVSIKRRGVEATLPVEGVLRALAVDRTSGALVLALTGTILAVPPERAAQLVLDPKDLVSANSGADFTAVAFEDGALVAGTGRGRLHFKDRGGRTWSIDDAHSPTSVVRYVAFDGGTHVLSAADDGSFSRVAWREGAEPERLDGHSADVTGLAAARGETFSISLDGALVRRDRRGTTTTGLAPPPRGAIRGLAATTGGVFAAHGDGSVHEWGGTPREIHRSPARPSCLALAPDGSRLLLGTLAGAVTMIDVKSRESTPFTPGFELTSAICAACFWRGASTPAFAVTGRFGNDGLGVVWTENEGYKNHAGPKPVTAAMVLAQDRVFLGGRQGAIRGFAIESPEAAKPTVELVARGEGLVRGLAVAGTGPRWLVAATDGEPAVEAWPLDAKTGVAGRPIELGVPGPASVLATSGDGALVAVAVAGRVVILDARELAVKQTIRLWPERDETTALAFGADTLWVGTSEGAIHAFALTR